MGWLTLGRIYSIEADGSINYSKPDGILSGPDQDRGALEGAIWAIVPFVRFFYSF